MYPPPVAITDPDRQDLVNQLLAAVLQTRATLDNIHRATALSPPDQPQAAADLTDAATSLTHVHDMLLHAADTTSETATQHP